MIDTSEPKQITIVRQVVPYKKMRYGTVGDWQYVGVGDGLQITVARLKNRVWEYLVTIHEEIEADLCRIANIKEEDVTAFDVAYEESRRLNLERAPCGCKHQDEPGDDLHAPYRDAHRTASHCERIIAKALDVDWEEYSREVIKLEDKATEIRGQGAEGQS